MDLHLTVEMVEQENKITATGGDVGIPSRWWRRKHLLSIWSTVGDATHGGGQGMLFMQAWHQEVALQALMDIQTLVAAGGGGLRHAGAGPQTG